MFFFINGWIDLSEISLSLPFKFKYCNKQNINISIEMPRNSANARVSIYNFPDSPTSRLKKKKKNGTNDLIRVFVKIVIIITNEW